MTVNFGVRRAESGIIVIALTGQLTSGKMQAEIEYKILELIREGARKMVVDLSELTFIDSSGLGSMMTCAGTIGKQGGKLVIVGATGKVNQMFEITGLGRVIGVYADLASAAEAFASPHPIAPEA